MSDASKYASQRVFDGKRLLSSESVAKLRASYERADAMSDDTEKLLPCPFCGDVPVIRQSRDHFIISCQNDGCVVNPRTSSKWDAEVIEDWNTRHKPSEG